MRICSAEHGVPFDLCVYDLRHDIFICESHNESVFRRVVFILVLHYESFACIVICLSLYVALLACSVYIRVLRHMSEGVNIVHTTTTTILDLESLEICLVFDDFCECLQCILVLALRASTWGRCTMIAVCISHKKCVVDEQGC